MATLYLVRHGQSVANAEGWLSGWVDTPLTAAGAAEAEAARAQLAEIHMDRCLVSDLQRARRTAEILLRGRRTPVQVLPELRERRMGALAGERLAALRADGRWAAQLAPWTAQPEGGESHLGCLRRVIACLRAWEAPGQTVLVVGHGGWIRDLLACLEGVPPEEIGRRPPALNAAPIRVDIGAWPDV